MTYRDDQDAALARADALQVDLDRSRTELERTKALLARREAELAAEKTRTAPSAPEPGPRVIPGRDNPKLAVGIAAVAFAGALGVVMFTKVRHDADRAAQNKAFERSMSHADLGADLLRSCTVRTEPTGARVVSVGPEGLYAMGSTPFSRSIGSWQIGNEHLEARLDGYESVTLTEPAMNYETGLCETTIVLKPISAR